MIPYRDNLTCEHRPIVTWSLIAVNVLIFLYTLTMQEQSLNRVFYTYGLVPVRYTNPEWAHFYGLSSKNYWSFLTNMFFHGGWMHILMNSWMLWIFGDNIEDRMGPVRFIAFFLLCGFIADLVQVIYNPRSPVPTIGASGAVAGILGAYYFLFPYARIVVWIPLLFLPIFVQVPAIGFLGIWVIIQLYRATKALAEATDYTEVAWWGHLGGFLAGALLYRFFLRPPDKA